MGVDGCGRGANAGRRSVLLDAFNARRFAPPASRPSCIDRVRALRAPGHGRGDGRGGPDARSIFPSALQGGHDDEPASVPEGATTARGPSTDALSKCRRAPRLPSGRLREPVTNSAESTRASSAARPRRILHDSAKKRSRGHDDDIRFHARCLATACRRSCGSTASGVARLSCNVYGLTGGGTKLDWVSTVNFR